MSAFQFPFVGREKHIAAAERQASQVLAGSVQQRVVFRGPSGTGKTRLLKELDERLSQQGFEVLWVRGALSSFDEPFSTMQQLSEMLLTSPLWDDIDLSALPDEDAELLSDAAALLTDEAPQDVLLRRRQDVIAKATSALASQRPLAFLVDDGQLVDESSAKFLWEILEQPQLLAAPLLGVVASSPPHSGFPTMKYLLKMQGGERSETVFLEPFTDTEMAELTKHAGRGGAWDDPLLAELGDLTSGLAFEVIETLRYVREAADGPIGTLWELEVPPSIDAVCTRWFDSLDEPAQHVLSAVAVLEPHATVETLTSVSQQHPTVLQQSLDELLCRGIVECDTDSIYQVYHSHARRMVKHLAGTTARHTLHRRAGTWFATRTPVSHGLVAEHFCAAADRETALPHLIAYGDQSLAAGAHMAAHRAYKSALSIHRSRPRSLDMDWEWDVLTKFEEALSNFDDLKEWGEILDKMFKLAWDDEHEADARRRYARWLVHGGMYELALKHAKAAVSLSTEGTHEHARALLSYALALVDTSHYEQADIALQKALAQEQLTGRFRVEALLGRSKILQGLRQYHDAYGIVEQLQAIDCTEAAHTKAEAFVVLAEAALRIGDVTFAERTVRSALTTFTRLHLRPSIGQARRTYGTILYFSSRTVAALQQFKRAVDVLEQTGPVQELTMAKVELAYIHISLGQVREARKLLRSVQSAAPSDLSDDEQMMVHLAHLSLALYEGRHSEAWGHVHLAQRSYSGNGSVWKYVLVATHEAHMLTLLQKYDEALECLMDVRDEAAGNAFMRPFVDAAIGETHIQAGEPEQGLVFTSGAVPALGPAAERPWLVKLIHSHALQQVGHEEDARREVAEALSLLEESLNGFKEDVVLHALTSVPENRQLLVHASTMGALPQRYAHLMR